QLGTGADVQPFGDVEGCSGAGTRAIVSAAGNVFLYEVFGFIGDRRANCRRAVPGGAWIIDSASGRLVRQIAPDLHFSALLTNRTGTMVYGLSTGDAKWESRVQLVRMDARDGRVLESRELNSDFWRIAMVSLRFIPSGVVRLSGPPE